MARVKFAEMWKNLTQGEDQILTITSSTYDKKTGVAKVRFEDDDGGSATETYRLGAKGKRMTPANEGASRAYGFLMRAAFRDPDLDSFDPDSDPDALVGRHVLVNVEAQEDNGKTYTHPRNFRDAEVDDPYLPEDGGEEGEGLDDEDDDDLFGDR